MWWVALTHKSGNRIRYTIALPVSIISDMPHLREKSAKLGVIARACAIFGVSEIVLYADSDTKAQENDFAICELILRFLETPQYLRKRLFGMNPILRFAGILPPLQIPSHNVGKSIEEVKVADIREGLVVGHEGEVSLVDVGLDRPVRCRGKHPIMNRLTIRLLKVGVVDPQGEAFDRSKIDIYWGFQVRARKLKLDSLLQERYDLKIGTSHYGSNLIDCYSNIIESLRKVESVMIVFGSPKQGLQDILASECKVPSALFDYFINTIPGQNVSTVRTEEAVMITLGILNLARLGK